MKQDQKYISFDTTGYPDAKIYLLSFYRDLSKIQFNFILFIYQLLIYQPDGLLNWEG